MSEQVRELLAVEHGDGGLGEQTYQVGEDRAGRTTAEGRCALALLVADEQAWEALSDELGLTVTRHVSDDLEPHEQQVVREIGTPCVLARLAGGALEPVAIAERLEVFEGDVTRLLREVRLVADQRDWSLPARPEDTGVEKVCEY